MVEGCYHQGAWVCVETFEGSGTVAEEALRSEDCGAVIPCWYLGLVLVPSCWEEEVGSWMDGSLFGDTKQCRANCDDSATV